MQTSLLPAPSCETLDKLNRRFLWGSTEQQRKISLVAWDAVCTPKCTGGLGLRHAKLQNQAHLMKVRWRMVKCRDEFWVKVLRDKYRCGNDLMSTIDQERSGSNIWLGIKKTWEKVKEDNGSNARWKYDRNGHFSVKSAYEHLSQPNRTPDTLWAKIWKLRIPQRCRTTIWLMARKSLLTNAMRHRRGLADDGYCQVCKRGLEELIHVFRDCPETKLLWQKLIRPSLWRRFWELEFNDWFGWNITSKHVNGDECNTTFAVICWWLWRLSESGSF